MRMDVVIMNPAEVIFEGQAGSIIVPGEQGVFELLPFHKPILSRILSGAVVVDGRTISMRRGIVKFDNNRATIIVE